MIFTATEQPRTSEKRRNRQIKLHQQTDGFINGQPHHASKAALQMLDKHAAQALDSVCTGFIHRFAALNVGKDFVRG